MNRNLTFCPFFRMIVLASLCASTALLQACNGNKSDGMSSGAGGRRTGSGSGADRGGSATETDPETQQVIRQLDQQYVIGPTAGGEMDYRIGWQFDVTARSTLQGMALRGDSLYTLDDQNFLTRLRVVDGHQVWRTQAAEPVVRIISVNVADDRVYLNAGGEMLVFDAVNSTQVAKWSLDKIAATPPVEYGPYFIYGARTGEIVWVSRQIGFMSSAYYISHSIAVPPVIKGDTLAAVGNDGEVVVLNAANARRLWGKKLLEPVVCKPVIGEGMLYVAGQDQYLWGYDLASGRTQWSVFTSAPLTDSPTLIGERVYQQIPGAGLWCFNANPIDQPGGEKFWQSDKVTGNVLLERRGDLFVWDADAKKLQIIEANRGGIKDTLDLSQVDFLMLGGEGGNDIFVASRDGRVERLSPRN
jgi:outer membrane protein assembly factor BamB